MDGIECKLINTCFYPFLSLDDLLYCRPILMISDFGECELLDQMIPDRQRSGATGTLEFMAPELLEEDASTGKPKNIFDTRSDIWSVGMIAYYMLHLRLPYVSDLEDIDALRKEILESEFKPLLAKPPSAPSDLDFLFEIINRYVDEIALWRLNYMIT